MLCTRCNTDKAEDEFGNKKTRKSGKQVWCKLCTSTYYNKWRIDNKSISKPLEIKQFNKFYTSIHGRAVHMLNNLRARAKRNDIECNISIEWIEGRLNKGTCEATGLPFILKTNQGKGHRTNSFSPSIDRIDQTGPYTESNCEMTCWIYNRAKGAFPLADLIIMMESYLQFHKTPINVADETTGILACSPLSSQENNMPCRI